MLEQVSGEKHSGRVFLWSYCTLCRCGCSRYILASHNSIVSCNYCLVYSPLIIQGKHFHQLQFHLKTKINTTGFYCIYAV